MTQPTKDILFFDSDCGFCQASVDWIAFHDTEQKLEFIPYQLEATNPTHPEIDIQHATHGVQILFHHTRTVWSDERAIAACLRQLPGWSLLGDFILLPGINTICHLGYKIIAANRTLISRILGLNACKIPQKPS